MRIIPIFDQYLALMIRKFIYLTLFTILSFFTLTTCSKSTPAPDYPELMGSWSGSTSQSQVITFYIDNIQGTLNLTSLKFIVFFDTGGQQSIIRYNTEGITPLSNTSFKYLMGSGVYGQAYIEGSFNTNNMTVTGTFRIYNPANPNDLTSGTFVGSK